MYTKRTIFKRGLYVLPSTSNESSFFMHSGELHAISFQRYPHSSIQIIIYKIVNGVSIQLAAWPWGAGFGSILVESDGSLHIFGSTSPGIYSAGNDIIHSILDPVTFQPSSPNALYNATSAGPTYCINNVGVNKRPDGSYVMFVDLMDANDRSQGRTIFLQSASVSSGWVRFSNQFPRASDSLYIGAFKPFYVPAGAHPNRCYMVYITAANGSPGYPAAPFYMNIAYTDDFVNFTAYNPNGTECYMFPDSPTLEGNNSSDGSEPFEMNGGVYVPYFSGDQATWASVRLGFVPNTTLADFVASFGM